VRHPQNFMAVITHGPFFYKRYLFEQQFLEENSVVQGTDLRVVIKVEIWVVVQKLPQALGVSDPEFFEGFLPEVYHKLVCDLSGVGFEPLFDLAEHSEERFVPLLLVRGYLR
jgi:hypothetical protein